MHSTLLKQLKKSDRRDLIWRHDALRTFVNALLNGGQCVRGIERRWSAEQDQNLPRCSWLSLYESVASTSLITVCNDIAIRKRESAKSAIDTHHVRDCEWSSNLLQAGGQRRPVRIRRGLQRRPGEGMTCRQESDRSGDILDCKKLCIMRQNESYVVVSLPPALLVEKRML